MKVYLYYKYTHETDELGLQVWGTYEGYIDFWCIPMSPISEKLNNKVKPIPLSIFEAKQIQKEHKKENTITPSKYWVESVN